MMEADDDHERDIPIWFHGTQRWMAGLTRRTTCDDVIYAILFSSGLHESEATDNYAIFEKWREVERPLSSRTKILKVWAFWGEEQPNVSLSMRSLNDYFLPGESSLYMRSRRRHKRQSKQRSSRHSPTCKCRDRKSCGECSRLKSLEHLVKLVVTQERKLQDLTDHIVDTDRLIEKHEGRIHEHRVQQNGLDYVQESYLNSHSSGSSSSLDSATLSVATLDLNEARGVFSESSLAELGEITRMCDQLTHLERRLAIERAKGEDLELEVGKLRRERGHEEREEEQQNAGVEEARVQLLRAVTSHVTQEYNERMLDRRMETCLAEVQDRTAFLQALHSQLAEVESRLSYSSMGSGPIHSDSDTPVHPLDHQPSSDSDGDVFTKTRPSVQTHKQTVQVDSLSFPYPHNAISQNLASNGKPHQPRGERDIPRAVPNGPNTITGLNSSGLTETAVGSSRSNSSSKTPKKSMTGRGRFAKDAIRKGVSSQPSSTNFPNSGIIQKEASGIVDSTNTDQPGAMVVSAGGGSGQIHGQSRTKAKSQRAVPARLDHNGHPVVNCFPGWAHSNGPSPSGSYEARALIDSRVNSVGSCGDISRLECSSSSPTLGSTEERIGRDRRGKSGERQVVGQTSAYRRSRSADRDQSHREGQGSRTTGRKQLRDQYQNGGDYSGGGYAYSMKVVNTYGLDPSSIGNDRFNQHEMFNNKKNRFKSVLDDTDFKPTNTFSPNAPSTTYQNKTPHANSKQVTFSQPTNNEERTQKPVNVTHHQNLSSYQSNRGHMSKPEGDGRNSYFSVFEENKQPHGQIKQTIPNKIQNRTTAGFVSREADHSKLDMLANSDTTGKGNEHIAARNGFSQRTSNNLRTGLQGTQDLDPRNDAVFAQGIPRNFQSRQTPNSQCSSPNNFDAQSHTKTSHSSSSSSSQNGTSSSRQTRDVIVSNKSQYEQKLSHEAGSYTNPPSSANIISNSSRSVGSHAYSPAPVNNPQPPPANGVESNPSRGALFHILSQKLNASKEKIRLNSLQDVSRGQTDVLNNCENEINMKQPQRHSQGRESASQQLMKDTQHRSHNQTASLSQNVEGGRSFVLASSTADVVPAVSSVMSNTNKGTTKMSSERVTAPSSSHSLPPYTTASEKRAMNGNTVPLKNGLSHHPHKDAGSYKIIPQNSHTSPNQQYYQRNQQQQYFQNQQQNRVQHQGQYQNNLTQYQPHSSPQQRQQSGYDSSYNRDHASFNHREDTPVQTNSSENAPFRRSALNPHFYDISKSGGKFLPRATPNNENTKKPGWNGSTDRLNDYHTDNNSTSIMSYLQHTNNGFLENLKSSALPPAMSSFRPGNVPTTTTNGSTRPTLAAHPSADHFDLTESRKGKSKMEDSNDSDTGLSSMHSDETANMETLV